MQDLTRRKFSLLSAGVTGAVAAGLPLALCAATGSSPVVETSTGKVRGLAHEGGTFSFKGIPYAASTAGKNRFMPPRPREPWSGVRECTEWGAIAPQGRSRANPAAGMGSNFARFFGVGSELPLVQSEDCLVLNVFTPALDNGKRPVMVWMHGGGFSIGGSSGARADGNNIARGQDVVTVSLNHRLGALGYCHLGALDGDFAQSGNAGQLDLVIALQWVRENIAAFGGDPENVMIHGESGGGGKVSTLMAMPAASGLFHRAICQSGIANRVPGVDEATEYALQYLAMLDVDRADVRKLQDLPVEQLIGVASELEMRNPMGMRRGFVPTSGTAELPLNPVDAVGQGSARLPFMIGCTKHEAALFLMAAGTDPGDIDEAMLSGRIQAMYPDSASELLAGYRDNHPDYSPGQLLVRIMSDRTRMGSIELAEAHIRGGGPGTYMYLFTWESPLMPLLGSAHGIDGTFYFDTTESVEIAAGIPEARRLAGAASAAWAAFARDGAPGSDGLPAWPQYTLEERQTMVLSSAPHIERDPLAADRKLWQEVNSGA